MAARRLAALLLAFVLPAVAGAQALYQEGQHYHLIQPAQPTDVADGKVEVLEVFSYACIHCAHFEPFISAWKKDLPAAAQFRYLPAVFSPSWEPYARAYYAAEALNALDTLHQPLFNALHQDRKPLATIEQIAEFAGTLGIDQAKFLQAAKSSSTDIKIKRSREQVMRYRIDGTPSLIVAGKYRVPTSAGGFQAMIDVANFLVAQEAGAAR